MRWSSSIEVERPWTLWEPAHRRRGAAGSARICVGVGHVPSTSLAALSCHRRGSWLSWSDMRRTPTSAWWATAGSRRRREHTRYSERGGMRARGRWASPPRRERRRAPQRPATERRRHGGQPCAAASPPGRRRRWRWSDGRRRGGLRSAARRGRTRWAAAATANFPDDGEDGSEHSERPRRRRRRLSHSEALCSRAGPQFLTTDSYCCLIRDRWRARLART